MSEYSLERAFFVRGTSIGVILDVRSGKVIKEAGMLPGEFSVTVKLLDVDGHLIKQNGKIYRTQLP